MNETSFPSMRVDGQVALVTGAGRGIGRGCAFAAYEDGDPPEVVHLFVFDFSETVSTRSCTVGKETRQ